MDDTSLILRLDEIAKGYWPKATVTDQQIAKHLKARQHMKGWSEEVQGLINKINSRTKKG